MAYKVYFEMPVWNVGKYVGAALSSIDDQTYPGCQVVVVDDGSTDNTMDVVAEALKNPRFKDSVLLTHPNHAHKQNVATANLAIQECFRRGADIIARLDGDDLQDKTRIEKQVAVLEAGSDIVSCNMTMFGMGRDPNWRVPQPRIGGINPDLYGTEKATGYEPCCGSLVAWARVYQEVGLFDPRSEWAPDSEWNFRTLYAQKYVWGHVPEYLYHYRVHPQSTTRLNPGKGQKEYKRLSKIYRQWVDGGRKERPCV